MCILATSGTFRATKPSCQELFTYVSRHMGSSMSNVETVVTHPRPKTHVLRCEPEEAAKNSEP